MTVYSTGVCQYPVTRLGREMGRRVGTQLRPAPALLQPTPTTVVPPRLTGSGGRGWPGCESLPSYTHACPRGSLVRGRATGFPGGSCEAQE